MFREDSNEIAAEIHRCPGSRRRDDGPAHAVTTYDADVKPDILFGSGVNNGGFTVDQNDGVGVELGLRAKLRFDDNNQAQNIFNSNGDGTYSFEAGLPPTGFGWVPGSTSTAVWNFEWSINSNFDGSSGYNLDDLTYTLDIDFDPSAGTNFLSFDPINGIDPTKPMDPLYYDHSIGNNGSDDTTDSVAGDSTEYSTLIAGNNVAQNSWNMEFFSTVAPQTFSGAARGIYTFTLTAFDGGTQGRPDQHDGLLDARTVEPGPAEPGRGRTGRRTPPPASPQRRC